MEKCADLEHFGVSAVAADVGGGINKQQASAGTTRNNINDSHFFGAVWAVHDDLLLENPVDRCLFMSSSERSFAVVVFYVFFGDVAGTGVQQAQRVEQKSNPKGGGFPWGFGDACFS